MNKLNKKIDHIKITLIVIFFIVIYIINTGLIDLDDEIYRSAFFDINSFIKWVIEFYNIWSGRIVILALNSIMMKLPSMIFKILNTLIYIVMILAIYKITKLLKGNIKLKIENTLLCIILFLTFCVDRTVLNSGGIWISGSLNYLWPFTFMLISIMPFIKILKNRKIKNGEYIVYIGSNLIACFSEQCGAILMCFSTIVLIYLVCIKKKINKLLIVHYITIIAITLCSLLAPGNIIRSEAEELAWYNGFNMLSISDKLMQGYIHTANHLMNKNIILFAILTMVSSYLIMSNKKIENINKYISIIPLVYIELNIFIFNLLDTDKIILFDLNKFGVESFYTTEFIMQFIISAMIILIVGTQLIYSFRSKKTGIIVSTLYYAAICSALALSFSPTIFVSGNRIFFVMDFLTVLIDSILLIELIQRLDNKKSKYWKIIFIILVIIFVYRYIFFALNCTNNIMYY